MKTVLSHEKISQGKVLYCLRCHGAFIPRGNRQVMCGDRERREGCAWENQKERIARYRRENYKLVRKTPLPKT